MADYEYDIFISYPHENDHLMWVHEFFLDKFSLYLKQELFRTPSIYVDKQRNMPGVTWPLGLKAALAQSKILLPIWSIDYFKSDWCRAECAVMLYREQQLQYRTVHKPEGLILPVRLFDGKGYPKFANRIASLDCTNYNIIFEGYKETGQYYALLQLVKDWVPEVARSIRSAPPWNADWFTDPWLTEPIRRFGIDPEFQFPDEPFTLEGMG